MKITKSGDNSLSSYLKQYGFVNQNSEIYAGFGKTWDLGPNGAEVKRKLKALWWKYFITSNPYNIPCETSILTPAKVLKASGHLKNFNDWVIECVKCGEKLRLDNLIAADKFLEFLKLPGAEKEKFFFTQKCSCGSFLSNPKQFNLMVKAEISRASSNNEEVYLRPETCQGIFVNFLILKGSKKLPLGVGQIGKSFRNEVTLNHGIFRTREFEQAELEFFVTENKDKWWEYWISKSWDFFQRLTNSNSKLTKKVVLNSDELPHYSLRTTDFHFQYRFGWGEVCSLSDRGCYDLQNHSQKSGSFLGVRNANGDKIFPHVVEVSFGIERLLLAVLEESYKEEVVEVSQLSRKYLKINPLLSPFFVAVMPLSKQLNQKSFEVYSELLKTGDFSVSYEETGNIGNRYRRQDAIGTFICITVDFQTLADETVTVRERDTMKQQRIPLKMVKSYLDKELSSLERGFLAS